MNLMSFFCLLATPCRCIRHELSGPVMYSAPVAICLVSLSSPIREDTSGSSMENMPPNPQHSSTLSGSRTVIPSTRESRSFILEYLGMLRSLGDDNHNSRTPWNELCKLTLCVILPGSVLTLRTSCRNSQISIIFSDVSQKCLPFSSLG